MKGRKKKGRMVGHHLNIEASETKKPSFIPFCHRGGDSTGSTSLLNAILKEGKIKTIPFDSDWFSK
jgi:hypothetical protein